MVEKEMSSNELYEELFKSEFSKVVDKCNLTFDDYLRLFAAVHNYTKTFGFIAMGRDMDKILTEKNK